MRCNQKLRRATTTSSRKNHGWFHSFHELLLAFYASHSKICHLYQSRSLLHIPHPKFLEPNVALNFIVAWLLEDCQRCVLDFPRCNPPVTNFVQKIPLYTMIRLRQCPIFKNARNVNEYSIIGGSRVKHVIRMHLL